MDDRIKKMLQLFIDELGADEYYPAIGNPGNGYKWGIIYERRTNDSVMLFRGRTYGDLLENIKYAYAAYRTMKRGF